MITNNENDLSISYLIKELRKIKREHGNLRVTTSLAGAKIIPLTKAILKENPRYLMKLTGRQYKK